MSATLEYELAQPDMEAFYKHHASNAPYIVARNRRMRWVWGGLLGALALAYSSWSPGGALAFLALALVYVFLYGRFNRWWYVRHNLRLNSGPDGPRLGTTKLQLFDNQLRIDAPEGSSTVELSAIRRINECDSHYFVYLGPAMAVVVPRSAEPAEGFISALRDARAAA